MDDVRVLDGALLTQAAQHSFPSEGTAAGPTLMTMPKDGEALSAKVQAPAVSGSCRLAVKMPQPLDGMANFAMRLGLRLGQLILYAAMVVPPAMLAGIACSCLLFALKMAAAFRDGTCEQSTWEAFLDGAPLAECEHVVGAHRWLLFFLGFSGLAVAALYTYMGTESAAGGMNTILKSIQWLGEEMKRQESTEHVHAAEGEPQHEEFQGLVSLRMCPLVWIGTVMTHLTGGSAGREGSALQMSAAIFSKYFDGLNLVGLRLNRNLALPVGLRRACLVASIAAGFSGVFGVPVTGAVFSVEVLRVGELQVGEALIPGLVGSFVADWACRAFNMYVFNFEGHSRYDCPSCRGDPQNWQPFLDFPQLMAASLAGIFFGLTAFAFEFLLSNFKQLFGRLSATLQSKSGVNKSLSMPFIGGIVVVLLWLLLCSFAASPRLNLPAEYDGTDPRSYTFAQPYLGLGVDSPGVSISTAFQRNPAGPGVAWYSFMLKLLLTTLTLGAGFKGGEVTPLFFIGATLGNVVGVALGQDTQLFSALGFVAVFAGACNTPIACTMMGIELFGGAKAFCFLVACYMSYLVSNVDKVNGIYAAQAKPLIQVEPRARANRLAQV